MDPRHERRVKIIQNLYARMFAIPKDHVIAPNTETLDIVEAIIGESETIDRHITTHAPKYPLDKIAKIDLCILRLAIYEVMSKKEPVKVVINEAVELAKELGNERSYAFINAVLGSVLKTVINEEQINES